MDVLRSFIGMDEFVEHIYSGKSELPYDHAIENQLSAKADIFHITPGKIRRNVH